MRPREFIKVIVGSVAAVGPLAARAQQAERMRRIGVLVPFAANDPGGRAASSHSRKRYSNWGGPRAAMYRSNTAGRRECR